MFTRVVCGGITAHRNTKQGAAGQACACSKGRSAGEHKVMRYDMKNDLHFKSGPF